MTLVSHRAKFIFLRTHKTGSTSIELSLAPLCLPPGDKRDVARSDMIVTDHGVVSARSANMGERKWRPHMSAALVRRQLPREIWRDYFKFSIARNPYDQLVSMFWWHGRGGGRRGMAKAPFDEVRRAFSAWLQTVELRKNHSKMTIGPRFVLDHVLFYERLATDYAEIASMLGLPETLPRHKSRTRKRQEHFSEYYDDDARRLVERACAFELAFFGYDLSGGPKQASRLTRAGKLLRSAPLYAPSILRYPQERPLRKLLTQ